MVSFVPAPGIGSDICPSGTAARAPVHDVASSECVDQLWQQHALQNALTSPQHASRRYLHCQRNTLPIFLEELTFLALHDETVYYREREERSIMGWNTAGGMPFPIHRLPEDRCLVELVNDWIVVVSESGGIQVISPKDGKIVHQNPLAGLQMPIRAESYFKVVDDQLYLSCENATFARWHIPTGRQTGQFENLVSRITHLVVQENRVIASCADQSVLVWPEAGGAPHFTLQGHTGEIVKLSCYNNRLITASKDKSICIWNLNDGKCIARIATATPFFEVSDGLLITPTPQQRTGITCYDLQNGKEESLQREGHSTPISCMARANGILYTGSVGGRVIAWSQPPVIYARHCGAVEKIYPLNDGHLVTYGRDCKAKVWQSATGNQLYSFDLNGFELRQMHFSSGKILFVSTMDIVGAISYPRQTNVSSSPRSAFIISPRQALA